MIQSSSKKMIIEPKVRGFICTTTHPKGCQKNVENEVAFFKKAKDSLPSNHSTKVRNVLVIGGSTGYGLSSRIAAHFMLHSATLNVCVEREPLENRPASPGWYNTQTLEKIAQNEGFYAQSIFKDGFLQQTKQETIEKIKKDLGKIDLLIYSVAAARRLDEKTDILYQSVLKPIGKTLKEKTVHWQSKKITEISIEQASAEEIEATTKVMGGEDWQAWVEILKENDLIAPNFATVAYSYVGPEITQDIYRQGTIGQAKKHLEKTSEYLNQILSPLQARACIAVNKAIVTQAASAIPIIPLYLSILFKVMREKGIHEGAPEQILRLFRDKLFQQDCPQTVRMDDWEMRPDVQEEVKKIWDKIDQENVEELSDIDLYGADFLKLFGFGRKDVEYKTDVSPFL